MPVTPVNKQNVSKIAQSFYVNRDSGIFVTKIGLFFKSVPASGGQPVYVALRTMEQGLPNGDVFIAKAEKTFSEIDGNESADATSEVIFEFPYPIYLSPFTYYAFSVETNSAEYELYYSEIYEHILNSTERLVDKNPVSGSIFYSQNGVTWSEDQNQDLKFKIYKANWSGNYDNNQAISIKLHNKDLPLAPLRDNPIVTDGTTDFFVTHVNHGFQEGDKVTISGVTGGDDNYVGGIHVGNINGLRTIKSGSGNTAARDWTGYIVSAGTGETNTTLSSEIGGGTNVKAEKNLLYTSFVPTVDVLKTPQTGVTFGVKQFTAQKNVFNSESGAYSRPTGYSQVKIKSTNSQREQPALIANKTMEAEHPGTEMANNKSFEIVCNIGSSDVENVMPFIDMERANVATMFAAIDNPSLTINSADGKNKLINPIAETLPEGGTTLAKHITKIFSLETTSIGLKVFIAANQPKGSGHNLYYRVGSVDENLQNKNWVLIESENSPAANEIRGRYVDWEYLIGGQDGLSTEFQQFQFKITMFAENAVKYPILREFRAIALGT